MSGSGANFTGSMDGITRGRFRSDWEKVPAESEGSRVHHFPQTPNPAKVLGEPRLTRSVSKTKAVLTGGFRSFSILVHTRVII